MFSKSFSIAIQAPPEQVFSYVTDIKRHPEWASNRMEMKVSGDPVQVGTTFESVVNAFGKESARGTVIDMDAPRRFVYEVSAQSSGDWRWTMSITPDGAGSKLTHTAEGLKLPLWFKVISPVAFPFVGARMIKTGLKNIKSRVESGVATG